VDGLAHLEAACDVHQHVDPRKLRDDPRGDRPHRRLRGHVGGDQQVPASPASSGKTPEGRASSRSSSARRAPAAKEMPGHGLAEGAWRRR